MKRRWKLAAVVVIVLTPGVYVWAEWSHDAAPPTSISKALRAFRSHVDSAHTHRPGLRRLGVYLYTTRGSETLNAAIFQSTHRYRGTSTITVEPFACGIRERWQVLTTRWNESIMCKVHNDLRLVSLSEHHEFFGTVSAPFYRCHDSQWPQPHSYRVGLRWTVSCVGKTGLLLIRSSVVAPQAIEIDKMRIPAFAVRSRVAFNGEVTGTSIVSDWRRRSDGLLLRRTVYTKAGVEILGGGSYDEGYSLAIMSTVPRR
jgi:hypothetical protein